ncbi:MAG: thiolase family protein [Bdellovibrionales bacterium]|nr:thiolase family protein [Bdellovibrionales bacterium]
MEKVFILSSARTGVGSFQGALGTTPAPRLGAEAIKAALSKSQIAATDIDECIMGNVLTAAVGQAPARQAAIYAGLPQKVECLTLNKVCGSGLKAVMLASDTIALGHAQVIVAGGQENMTLAPHALENSRGGYRMGHFQTTDTMIKDGLWDPYGQVHMGNCAELCATEYKLSREAQDQFAVESYQWAQKAQKDGLFQKEIAAFDVVQGKETLRFAADEEPGRVKYDKIPGLKPAFDKAGTVTAANASKINDGAAAVMLASQTFVKSKGLKPFAQVISQAAFAQDPKWFTTAPVGAIKKALTRANLTVNDIDLFEINEAFASVPMVAMKELGITRDRVNVHGGAIAIGHPIGASGARVLVTLLHALETRGLKRGLATLCIGGGEGAAVIVERV